MCIAPCAIFLLIQPKAFINSSIFYPVFFLRAAGHGGAGGVADRGDGPSGQHAYPRTRPSRASGPRQVVVHSDPAATSVHHHGSPSEVEVGVKGGLVNLQ